MLVRINSRQRCIADPAKTGVALRTRHFIAPQGFLYLRPARWTMSGIRLDPVLRVVLLKCSMKLVLPILALHFPLLWLAQTLPGLTKSPQVLREELAGREPVPNMLAEDAERKAAPRALGHVRILLFERNALTRGTRAVHNIAHTIKSPLKEEFVKTLKDLCCH